METNRKSLELMPKPFDWVNIPAGQVTVMPEKYKHKGVYMNYVPEGQSRTFSVNTFEMSKYPITNAQYRLFVDAGGYTEKRWWTEEGWQAKLSGWDWVNNGWNKTSKAWAQPRYWDNINFNGANQPVVGVSWYEAIAFCQWLSVKTNETITLPTEQQWQRAAQGDDGREYPWGNEFDKDRCNIKQSRIGKTTPVTQYEGKGDSQFGVVDMVGNVRKWCLTDPDSGNSIITGSWNRILRGGSWNGEVDGISLRERSDPHGRLNSIGFYCVSFLNI